MTVADLTIAERVVLCIWLGGHDINPMRVPRDEVSVDPGEGWTRIEWCEFVFDDQGGMVVTPDGTDVERTPTRERIVRGMPPFAVLDGRRVAP